jgi:SAM-dependent methyltransferase
MPVIGFDSQGLSPIGSVLIGSPRNDLAVIPEPDTRYPDGQDDPPRARPRHIASPVDRHDLYELCVQSPVHLVPLLRAIHGGDPRVLAEDFCGTAAVARHWVRAVPGARAVAVDHDPSVLDRAADAGADLAGRLTFIRGDAASASDLSIAAHRADVLFVGNFSIGEIHERAALVAYLRHARARLNPGGVIVCDTYGGESAFRLGAVTRPHPLPSPAGARVHYTWQQRRADPFTGMVECALHFRIEEAGQITDQLFDAFVYTWRLWSVPELRDAMREAGFISTEVHTRLPGAADAAPRTTPIADPRDIPPSFIVCVAGRVDRPSAQGAQGSQPVRDLKEPGGRGEEH